MVWTSSCHRVWTNTAALHVLSARDQTFMTCFPLSKKNQKYNLKLYIMPIKIVAPCCVTRSSVGPLKPGGKGPENGVSATSLFPDNHQSMDDFERQLQELFDDIKRMIRMGSKSDATDLLKANYEMVNERLSGGPKGVEEAAVLDIIALGFMAVGDLKFVDSLLNVVVFYTYAVILMKEVVNNLKDDAPRLDSILVHMGSMYSTLGNFEKSLDTYQRAIYILERTYGKDSTFLVTPYLGMAKVYGSDGKATKAREMYQYAITLLESSRGTESKDLVVPLLGLGNLLLNEGRAVDAEAHFTRVQNIYTSFYGQNDGRSGMAMSSLAQVKCAQGG